MLSWIQGNVLPTATGNNILLVLLTAQKRHSGDNQLQAAHVQLRRELQGDASLTEESHMKPGQDQSHVTLQAHSSHQVLRACIGNAISNCLAQRAQLGHVISEMSVDGFRNQASKLGTEFRNFSRKKVRNQNSGTRPANSGTEPVPFRNYQ